MQHILRRVLYHISGTGVICLQSGHSIPVLFMIWTIENAGAWTQLVDCDIACFDG